LIILFFFFFFFFQAEDGIRDFHVTGVQTCALPIYLTQVAEDIAAAGIQPAAHKLMSPALARRERWLLALRFAGSAALVAAEEAEIGRASCRERVEISVGGGAVKEKKIRERMWR